MNEEIKIWLERLQIDAAGALRDLLCGRSTLGSLSAAEPEDAAEALFGLEPLDSVYRRAFDRGCAQLLESFRTGIFGTEGQSFSIELSRLNALLSIIRRMLPQETVADLHRRYVLWNGFFENFVIDRSFDLRREFFRVLAMSQNTRAPNSVDQRRLMPLWLSICAESGENGRYSQDYLRVALMGLRKLPLGQHFSANEDFVLHGLARWAVHQNPREDAFAREWRIVQNEFPRNAGFWTERVRATVAAAEEELSERTRGQHRSFPLAGWWLASVGAQTSSVVTSQSSSIYLPSKENREAILRRIADSYRKLAPGLDRLMDGHRRYADATGDVFYLVRTACNIGMRLLEHGAPEERQVRGERAVSLASLAFQYDPTNVFAWSLMLSALIAAGRVADGELVGWEAIRRFPENFQWRPQLAMVLAVHAGKANEAATLLQDTVKIFPHEPSVRHQLAVVLADHLGDREGARRVIDVAIAEGVEDAGTRSLAKKLQAGKHLRSAKAVRSDNRLESSLELPTARARRLLFRFETGEITETEVKDFLEQTPRDAYLTYVAERTGVDPLPLKTTFALAFEDALHHAEPSALRALVARARSMDKAVIEQAISIGEGRVLPFPLVPSHSSYDRILDLSGVLSQNQASSEIKKKLLSDFVASELVSDVTFLHAA